MEGIETSVVVNTTDAECFKVWTSSEYLPGFIGKVDRTSMQEGRFYWHWKMRDPDGNTVRWETVVTDVEPNRMLSWRSVPGSAVDLQGTVHFIEEAAGQTRVRLTLKMEIAEQTTRAFAGEFFENPMHLAEEILGAFKDLVEQRVFLPPEMPVASGSGAGTETGKTSDIPLSVKVQGRTHELRDEPPL